MDSPRTPTILSPTPQRSAPPPLPLAPIYQDAAGYYRVPTPTPTPTIAVRSPAATPTRIPSLARTPRPTPSPRGSTRGRPRRSLSLSLRERPSFASSVILTDTPSPPKQDPPKQENSPPPRKRREPSPYSQQRAEVARVRRVSRPRSATLIQDPPAPAPAAMQVRAETDSPRPSEDTLAPDEGARYLEKDLPRPPSAFSSVDDTDGPSRPYSPRDGLYLADGGPHVVPLVFQSVTTRPRAASTYSWASAYSLPRPPGMAHNWHVEHDAARLRAQRSIRTDGMYQCPKMGCREVFGTEKELRIHMVFEMVDEVPMRKAPSIRARALSPIGLIGKAGRVRKGKAKEN